MRKIVASFVLVPVLLLVLSGGAVAAPRDWHHQASRTASTCAPVITFSGFAGGGPPTALTLLPFLQSNCVAVERAYVAFRDVVGHTVLPTAWYPHFLPTGREQALGATWRVIVCSLHSTYIVSFVIMSLDGTTVLWQRDERFQNRFHQCP